MNSTRSRRAVTPVCGFDQPSTTTTNTIVNDHHSLLNPTRVASIKSPDSLRQLTAIVRDAHATGQQVSIAGGRHAMGGQQFLSNGILIDMTLFNKIVAFDRNRGLLEVEAGMMWPALINYLRETQRHSTCQWTIAQKQTGCDLLTIGGALAANVHGRGLGKAPLVCDVEEFKIVMHDGKIKRCSRQRNAELFSLAIGGYGLFGIIASVTLRLVQRVTLRRSVQVCRTSQAAELLESQQRCGATYGDFQFAIDSASADFLQVGILSTYSPVGAQGEQYRESERKLLSEDQWQELLFLAHTDKSRAFEIYRDHYLATDRQLYLSDTFQLATYINGYHKMIDDRLGENCAGSEAITELYVPRHRLDEFMKRAASLLRAEAASVIYGTVRLIEQDKETFLAWANQPWACIIFNLHVDHNNGQIQAISGTFRKLFQLAIEFGGKYYLTYNKYAAANQLQACYPQISQFIELKHQYDPTFRFNSDWFNYVRNSRNYF
ncbi:MAG: FAD-binding oxidoreductase [Candidatus Melainabacteria bacterium]|nr:MAG: FAD-binding oxidoreductase [Candidatus Melainabacteria bacterium]